MSVYYVDSTLGSDSNAGITTAAPWATIDKVNAKIADSTIIAGDQVLFKRGETFYGKVVPPSGLSASANYLTFGPYGAGDRPRLSMFKLLNTGASWTEHASGVWKIDLTSAATHSGYTANTTNIGFLKLNDSLYYGNRVWAVGDLTDPWDFYCDATYLYVKASANPTTLADDIKASAIAGGSNGLFTLYTSIRIHGLEIVGCAGGSGIQGWGVAVQHARVYDCEIWDIGGGLLSGTTRFGNGVTIGIGASDVVVEDNIIHDCYDVGLTMQGTLSGSLKAWNDCHFRRNTIYRCYQSLEFWTGGTTEAGAGFVGSTCDDNLCLSAGDNWSSSVRPDTENCCHLLTYGWTLPDDLSVRRNVFYLTQFDGDQTKARYRHGSVDTSGGSMVIEDNLVFATAGTQLYHIGSGSSPTTPQTYDQTIEEAAAYVEATGDDVGTQFFVLPAAAPTYVDAVDQLAGDTAMAVAHSRQNQRGLARLRSAIEKLAADLVQATRVVTPTTDSSDIWFSIRRVGDTYPRVEFNGGGQIKIGNGTNLPVTVYGLSATALIVNGAWQSVGAATTSSGFITSVTGENTSRWVVASDGKMSWGDGTNAKDVTLYRASADLLKTDDSFQVVGDLIVATKTPASAAATGVAGTIAWDANYVYVCTATNTWKRAAIATW